MRFLTQHGLYFLKKILTLLLITPFSNLLFFITSKISQWFFYRIQLNLLLKKHEVTLTLDVGANAGNFAEKLSYFFSGKIISFEPVAAIFTKLNRKTLVRRNWLCYQIALGSADSQATIFVAKNSLFSSMHGNNQTSVEIFGQQSQGQTPETITVKRFDTFAAERNLATVGEKIFLKMDTQGHDLEVFKGLGKHLEQVFVIQTELSLIPLYENTPHWTETITTIENVGFRVVAMFPVNKHGDQVIEYDCIFERSA